MYVQDWSTVESILHYVRTNLLPRRNTRMPDAQGRPPRFLLILDYYGVHVSALFRKRFREEFGETGAFVFVPPNMTGECQPLDMAVFGVFKPCAKRIHTTEIVEGAFQHLWRREPKQFEFSTAQARKACVNSIGSAWAETAVTLKRAQSKLPEAWSGVTPPILLDGITSSQRVAADDEQRKQNGYRRLRSPTGSSPVHSVTLLRAHQLSCPPKLKRRRRRTMLIQMS